MAEQIEGRSPREILESRDSDPKVEHCYVKFPGKELVNTGFLEASYDSCMSSIFIKKRLWKENGKRAFIDIHTHPCDGVKFNDPNSFLYQLERFPSGTDVEGFIFNDHKRTMVVVPRDESTGQILGYSMLRKTRKTYSYERPYTFWGWFFSDPTCPTFPEKREMIREYSDAYEGLSPAAREEALQRLTQGFKLRYKWIPIN